MRLWSLHPAYLDPQGLVALWREALLAQKVLSGATRGYRNHPQLERFRPVSGAISAYLNSILAEAQNRGYHFNPELVHPFPEEVQLPVTRGQLEFEANHLQKKLTVRNPRYLSGIVFTHPPRTHPIFYCIEGDVESWEKV